MSAKKPIAIGTRFSDLVILEEYPHRSSGGNVQYLCQCDCGKIAIAASANLRAGKHKSCGCRRHIGHRRLPDGQAGFNKLYYQYKKNDRGLDFEFSKEEFRLLTSQPCYYCGMIPSMEIKARINSRADPYIYNGIDQVDNTKGYVFNNCVSCCKFCNWMKRDLSQDEFFSHVQKINEKYWDGNGEK